MRKGKEEKKRNKKLRKRKTKTKRDYAKLCLRKRFDSEANCVMGRFLVPSPLERAAFQGAKGEAEPPGYQGRVANQKIGLGP
jgi:hypothetical protein